MSFELPVYTLVDGTPLEPGIPQGRFQYIVSNLTSGTVTLQTQAGPGIADWVDYPGGDITAPATEEFTSTGMVRFNPVGTNADVKLYITPIDYYG